MRYREQYDWVVLGDHPGALLSGALAARLGLSVLILPLAPSFTLRVSKSGQCLDPESNFLLGLGTSDTHPGLVSEALERLGTLPAESELIRSPEAALPQVLTPAHRVGFGKDEQDLRKQLVREIGAETLEKLGLIPALELGRKEFESFWLELPERLTLAAGKGKSGAGTPASPAKPLALKDLRKKLARAASGNKAQAVWMDSELSAFRFGLDQRLPELQELLSGLWYGICGQRWDDPSLAAAFQATALAYSGGAYAGGMSALRQVLMRVARRHGALVSEKAECRRIFVENGRFVGIQLSHRGEMISVVGGALGCALERAREITTSSGRSWLRQSGKAPTPTGWKFTIALTVHAEAIPPGAASRLVWQERDSAPLEIEVADPGDYGVKNPERQIIFLRTILPFTPESLSAPFQSLTAARMLRQATALFPYLEFHVLRIFPDFRVAANSPSLAIGESLADIYGFASLAQIPENLRCYSGTGMGYRSGVDGLFIASGEAYPELGTLGATVAAIEAVAWLAHRSGLPGPLA